VNGAAHRRVRLTAHPLNPAEPDESMDGLLNPATRQPFGHSQTLVLTPPWRHSPASHCLASRLTGTMCTPNSYSSVSVVLHPSPAKYRHWMGHLSRGNMVAMSMHLLRLRLCGCTTTSAMQYDLVHTMQPPGNLQSIEPISTIPGAMPETPAPHAAQRPQSLGTTQLGKSLVTPAQCGSSNVAVC
jgi:hypothetical protein